MVEKIILVILLIIVLALVGYFLPIIAESSGEDYCKSRMERLGYNYYQYSSSQGCFILGDDGNWYKPENIPTRSAP